MSISSTGSTASTSSLSSTAYTTKSSATADQINNPNAELTKNDFLQMLITKLQNQDPLNAIDDGTMVADMAQFSSLEQMSNLNSGMSTSMGSLNTNIIGLMAMENTSQAAALIGKTVTVTVDSKTGQTDTGTVSVVKFADGVPKIVVNGVEYGLSSVTEIQA